MLVYLDHKAQLDLTDNLEQAEHLEHQDRLALVECRVK